MKTVFQVKGMHCQSCKLLIEDVCRDIPGITACTVDPETGKVELEHADDLDLSAVKQEIESLGEYKVENL